MGKSGNLKKFPMSAKDFFLVLGMFLVVDPEIELNAKQQQSCLILFGLTTFII